MMHLLLISQAPGVGRALLEVFTLPLIQELRSIRFLFREREIADERAQKLGTRLGGDLANGLEKATGLIKRSLWQPSCAFSVASTSNRLRF